MAAATRVPVSKWSTFLLATLCLGVMIRIQLAGANDPDPLQDIAVADLEAKEQVNGYLAKPASEVGIADFITSALAEAGDTASHKLKAVVTPAFAPQFQGLNTLGVGASRIDFEAGGLNPPHIHPRASKFFFLVEGGPLHVGFVTSTTNPATNVPPNVLYNGSLHKGQGIVFPRGLLHFQKNIGDNKAFAIAGFNSQNPGFNSQNPGVEVLGDILFGASPHPISADILEQALGIGGNILDKLMAAAAKE